MKKKQWIVKLLAMYLVFVMVMLSPAQMLVSAEEGIAAETSGCTEETEIALENEEVSGEEISEEQSEAELAIESEAVETLPEESEAEPETENTEQEMLSPILNGESETIAEVPFIPSVKTARGSYSSLTGTNTAELVSYAAQSEAVTASDEVSFDVNDYMVLADAAAVLRTAMKNRQGAVKVVVKTTEFTDFESMETALLNAAWAVTEHGDEGDYIRHSFERYTYSVNQVILSSVYCYTYSFEIAYNSTEEQEREVKTKVQEILAQILTDDMNEYQKIRGIYEYITSHVDYDYAHLADSSYRLQFTAYAALIQGTSVCQGYALLFYHMAKEAGLDVRVITGTSNNENHAWNIVRIGELYYNLDSTWDSQTAEYTYFLKGSLDFDDHTRALEYTTSAFHAVHPMADTAYDPNASSTEEIVAASGVCGQSATWKLIQNAVAEDGTVYYSLVIEGSGNMSDYADENSTPWSAYKENITICKVLDGVTGIGANACAGCVNLQGVLIPSTVTGIGDYAFFNCSSLTQLDIPESVTALGRFVIGGEYGSVLWEYLKTEKKLRITGEGAMGEPYAEGSSTEKATEYVPWNKYVADIVSIEIESGVANISTFAFHSAKSLTEIVIPNTVTEIGDSAFEYCESLTSIEIPESVTSIGPFAFRYCTGFRKFFVPSGIRAIGIDAFNGCAYLRAFYYYGAAPAFGARAMMNTDLITVYYPSGTNWNAAKSQFDNINFAEWDTTSLPDGSLSEEELKNETNGNYGANIYWNYDQETKTLTLTGSGEMSEPYVLNEEYTDGTIVRSYATNAVPWHPWRTEIKTVVLDERITRITRYAFYFNIGLSTIQIPKAVTEIGQEAFRYCGNLIAIEIPESVSSIGKSAFGDCTGLQNIYFLGAPPTMQSDLFTNVTANGYYPEALSSWSSYITSSYGGDIRWIPLKSKALTFSADNMVTVMQGETAEWEALLEVYSSTDAASEADAIVWTVSDETVAEIESVSHTESGTKSRIVLAIKALKPGVVTITGTTSDERKTAVAVTVIPSDEKTVSLLFGTMSEEPFMAETQRVITAYLTVVEGVDPKSEAEAVVWTVSDPSVLSVSTSSCYASSDTTSTLVIMMNAFEPGVVTITGTTSDGKTAELEVEVKPDWWTYEDGVLTLIKNGPMTEDYLDTTECPWADMRSEITELVLKSEVTLIGAGMLEGCSNLRTITREDCVITSIGDRAFAGCTAFTEMTFFRSLEKIGDRAFAGCTCLEKVVFFGAPEMGSSVFSGCSSLDVMEFEASAPVFASQTFSGLTAEGYYVRGDETWTADKRQNFGGNITWKVFPFSAKRDGWPVGNNAKFFGTANYKLPDGIYDEVYNDSNFVTAVKSRLSWGGNCFGLSVLAASDYEELIDMSDYFTNEGNTLVEYGYSGVSMNASGQYYHEIKSDTAGKRMVERVMVSQWSQEFTEAEIFTSSPTYYSELLAYLSDEENAEEPIVVALEGSAAQGAHMVVIDPSIPYEDLRNVSGWGGGWKRIYLYDPNVPQDNGRLNNLADDYSWGAYLYVNTDDGSWTYRAVDASGSKLLELSNYYKVLAHTYIKFFDPELLPAGFFTDRLTPISAGQMFMVYAAGDISVTENDDEVLAFENDTLTTLKDGYDYSVWYGDGEEGHPVRYTFLNDAEISYTSSQASVQIGSDESDMMYEIETTGESCVSLNPVTGSVDVAAAAATVLSMEMNNGSDMPVSVVSELSADSSLSIDVDGDILNLDSSDDTVVTVSYEDNGAAVEKVIEVNGKTTVNLTEPAPVSNPFIDVHEWDYYYDSVLWAYENGITSGTGEGIFDPEASCTRGQVVTFLWRAKGQPEPETAECPFTDVHTWDYFYKAVLWAYENGITAGVSATEFGPETTVDRGQVVTFMWRDAGMPGASGDNPFADVPGGIYYHDAVLWAYENGVTAGINATEFGPSNPCTRGQVVTFLYRAIAEK